MVFQEASAMVDTSRRTVLAAISAGSALSLNSGAASAETDDGTANGWSGDSGEDVDERVAALVSRLTLDEKLTLLHQYQPPIPRLDMDAFRTGTEALHGVSWLGEATVFPQPIGLGSTWDPDLVERVGSAVGDEVRGKHNVTPSAAGLNVWAPTVDPLRDPRAGRNEEGYSEDPLLSGELALGYTSGLSGDDPYYLKTAPSLKHFFAYNNETDRTTTNAELPPRLLHDYYLQFFRPPVEAGTAVGVMASYNLVNGRPNTVSPLLDRVVRDWAPDGSAVMNVSDAWAPETLTGAQAHFDTKAKARAAAVVAGLDVFTEHGPDDTTTVEALSEAVDRGILSENEIDAAVGHVLSVRFRLGEFDRETPYDDLTDEVVGAREHRELARKAAQEGTVLLKNDDGGLPISDERSVAVVGPLADSVFTDWYSGTPPYRITAEEGIRDRIGADNVTTAQGIDRIALQEISSGSYVTAGVSPGGGGLYLSDQNAPGVQQFDAAQWSSDAWTLRATGNNRYVTVEDGQLINSAEKPYGWEEVAEAFEFVRLDDGSTALRHRKTDAFVTAADGGLAVDGETESDAARFDVERRRNGVQDAARTARDADVAVLVVGTHPLIGARETHDRDDLDLPESQRRLIEAVTSANRRTVLVLQSSYPVAINWADRHTPSILWTSHAGQETGRALADVLFGDVSPSGRLPQTWPRSADGLPDIKEYNIARTGMTYRYGQENPLYAFGHGLSYSSFRYDHLRISPRSHLSPGETATVKVRVTNTGSMAADDVVQLYSRQRRSRTRQPEQVLRGFERVHLEPGERTCIEFELDYDEFSFWDVTRNRWVVERAKHDVAIGSASDDFGPRRTLRVDGERIPQRDLSEETRTVDADDWSWSSIELLDKSKADGTTVGFSDGSWVAFEDVDLHDRPEEAAVSVARAEGGSATAELRLGSPDGRLLGSADVPSTGDVYEYERVTTALRGATGGHRTVYLVARGEFRAHTVQFD